MLRRGNDAGRWATAAYPPLASEPAPEPVSDVSSEPPPADAAD